jgi:hypothetical protein
MVAALPPNFGTNWGLRFAGKLLLTKLELCQGISRSESSSSVLTRNHVTHIYATLVYSAKVEFADFALDSLSGSWLVSML